MSASSFGPESTSIPETVISKKDSVQTTEICNGKRMRKY
jgi:hypothetical protein